MSKGPITPHKDLFGQVLNIGDVVAMIVPNYRMIDKGTIVAMTPQNVRIKYGATTLLAPPDDVVLAPEKFQRKNKEQA